MSLQSLVPPDSATDFLPCFQLAVDNMEFDLLRALSDPDIPLTHEHIMAIGGAVLPSKIARHAANGLLYDVADALKTTQGLTIAKFFASGEYARRTAVGTFRSYQIVVYLKDDHGTFKSHEGLVSHLYDYLNQYYASRRKLNAESEKMGIREEKPDCRVSKQNGSLFIHCGRISMKILLAHAKYCYEKDEVIADVLEQVYIDLASHPDPAKCNGIFSAIFQERCDRFIQSLPDEWCRFIRFAKYWTVLHCDQLISQDAVEVLALKILLKENRSFDHDFDSVYCFMKFLVSLSNPILINDINKVALPSDAFMRPPFEDECKQRRLRDIQWDQFEAFPKSKSACPITLTQLFFPTHNLVGFMIDREWNAIQSIVANVLEETNDRVLTLRGCFIGVLNENNEKDYVQTRQNSRSVLTNTLLFLSRLTFWSSFLAILPTFTMMTMLMESPQGTLNHDQFDGLAYDLEIGWLKSVDWMQDHSLSPIVDSSMFGFIEDGLMKTADMISNIPTNWEVYVPLATRVELVKSRDHGIKSLNKFIDKMSPTYYLATTYARQIYKNFNE